MTAILYKIKPGMTEAPGTSDLSFADLRFRTGADPRVALDAEDGPNPRTFRAKVMQVANIRIAEPEAMPYTDWSMDLEVTVTATRLIFWSPLVTGLFGSPKPKPGAATGGTIDYRDITDLGVMAMDSHGIGITLTAHGSKNLPTTGIPLTLLTSICPAPADLPVLLAAITRAHKAYWDSHGGNTVAYDVDTFLAAALAGDPARIDEAAQVKVIPTASGHTAMYGHEEGQGSFVIDAKTLVLDAAPSPDQPAAPVAPSAPPVTTALLPVSPIPAAAAPIPPSPRDLRDPAQASAALADPTTSPADLMQIAATHPPLWSGVARHPAAYPDLLAWLTQVGDVGVRAAVASRPGTQTLG